MTDSATVILLETEGGSTSTTLQPTPGARERFGLKESHNDSAAALAVLNRERIDPSDSATLQRCDSAEIVTVKNRERVGLNDSATIILFGGVRSSTSTTLQPTPQQLFFWKQREVRPQRLCNRLLERERGSASATLRTTPQHLLLYFAERGSTSRQLLCNKYCCARGRCVLGSNATDVKSNNAA